MNDPILHRWAELAGLLTEQEEEEQVLPPGGNQVTARPHTHGVHCSLGAAKGDISEYTTLISLSNPGSFKNVLPQLQAIAKEVQDGTTTAVDADKKMTALVSPLSTNVTGFVATKFNKSHGCLLARGDFDTLEAVWAEGLAAAHRVREHVRLSSSFGGANIIEVIDTAQMAAGPGGQGTVHDLEVVLDVPWTEEMGAKYEKNGNLKIGYSQKVGSSSAGAINGGFGDFGTEGASIAKQAAKKWREELYRHFKEKGVELPDPSSSKGWGRKTLEQIEGYDHDEMQGLGGGAVAVVAGALSGKSDALKSWLKGGMSRSEGLFSFMLKEGQPIPDENNPDLPSASASHATAVVAIGPDGVLDLYTKPPNKVLYIVWKNSPKGEQVIAKISPRHAIGPGRPDDPGQTNSAVPSLSVTGTFPDPGDTPSGWAPAEPGSFTYVPPKPLEQVPDDIISWMKDTDIEKINSTSGSPIKSGTGSGHSVFSPYFAKAPSDSVFNNRDWTQMTDGEREELRDTLFWRTWAKKLGVNAVGDKDRRTARAEDFTTAFGGLTKGEAEAHLPIVKAALEFDEQMESLLGQNLSSSAVFWKGKVFADPSKTKTKGLGTFIAKKFGLNASTKVVPLEDFFGVARLVKDKYPAAVKRVKGKSGKWHYFIIGKILHAEWTKDRKPWTPPEPTIESKKYSLVHGLYS